MTEMTSRQEEAIQKLQKLKVGALFMKQGTGKTRVACELINSTNANYVLFICPNSVKDNLQEQLTLWGVKAAYEIIAYETISSSDKQYLELLERLKGRRLFVVADESIFIKNSDSKRFNRVVRIGELAEYRLILNGTPITKDEWDIYNQMYFLSPRIIGMGRQEFLNTFFTKIRVKKAFRAPREYYKLSKVNIDYLRRLISPYIYECELSLDIKQDIEYAPLQASIDAKTQYIKQKEELLQAIKNGNCELKMFTNLALTCFDDEYRHKQIAEYLKREGQVIVFCTLLNEVSNIAKDLDCYVITGETKNRSEILKKFKNDSKPLLMTLGTGAYGLNLQFCNKIIFASLGYDFGKLDQAESRIKRLGQKRSIEYVYMTSELGIYNFIIDNISKKKSIHDLIIEGLEADAVEKLL